MYAASNIYKFRATYTDGTRGIVKDHRDRALHCQDKRDAVKVAKGIAHRNDVQAVKVLTIPNCER